jgi:hypothetical protein
MIDTSIAKALSLVRTTEGETLRMGSLNVEGMELPWSTKETRAALAERRTFAALALGVNEEVALAVSLLSSFRAGTISEETVRREFGDDALELVKLIYPTSHLSATDLGRWLDVISKVEHVPTVAAFLFADQLMWIGDMMKTLTLARKVAPRLLVPTGVSKEHWDKNRKGWLDVIYLMDCIAVRLFAERDVKGKVLAALCYQHARREFSRSAGFRWAGLCYPKKSEDIRQGLCLFTAKSEVQRKANAMPATPVEEEQDIVWIEEQQGVDCEGRCVVVEGDKMREIDFPVEQTLMKLVMEV